MGTKRQAARRGFPANLYVNADGYFYYRNPLNGKRKGIGRDKTQAFSEARQANAALAVMSRSSLVAWVQGTEEYTLAGWIPEYRRLWHESKKLAENSKRDAEGFFRKLELSDLASMPITAIQTNHVAALLDRTGQESGKATAKNLRSRLKDVFRMAITKGLLKDNPVESSYVPISKTTRERLTLDQFVAIRAHAPDYLRNAMNLALVTGQRRADITEFKFSDFYDGHLHVEQGKGQGRVRLRISGSLTIAGIDLESTIKACRDAVVSQYLVHYTLNRTTIKKGDPVSPDRLTETFNESLARAKIKSEPGRRAPTFHEIRSLSERLYKAERGIEFSQKLLGHSDIKTTSMYDDLRGTGWENIG